MNKKEIIKELAKAGMEVFIVMKIMQKWH